MTCCTGVEQMFMRLLGCWKQQGSGEKVREAFRNLLERSLAMTQCNASALRPSPFFFLRQPHLLWWKDCNWLTWNLSFFLKAIRVSVEISSDRIQLHISWERLHSQLVSDGKITQYLCRLQLLNLAMEQNQHLWVFVSICAFSYILHAYFMCVCVCWDVHIHTVCLLLIHFSLTAWATNPGPACAVFCPQLCRTAV